MAADERNRVQKVLEDANGKIGDVLSEVFGLSGQLMLEASVPGSAVDGRAGRSSNADFALDFDPARDAAYGVPGRRERGAGPDIATPMQAANLTGAYELLQTHSRPLVTGGRNGFS